MRIVGPWKVVVDIMSTSVVVDVRSAINAKYENKDVEYDEWPEVVMDGISVKMPRQNKASVCVRCVYVICWVSGDMEGEGSG